MLETKWNEKNGWHPHLHCVLHADYLDHQWIKDRWETLTGGSKGVRIERVRTNGGIARYVAKYVTKQFDGSVFRDPDRLGEALRALHGTRAFGTFGSWRGVELVAEEEAFDPAEWKPLARLEDILELAEKGAVEAVRVWRLVTNRGAVEAPPDPPG